MVGGGHGHVLKGLGFWVFGIIWMIDDKKWKQNQ